MKLPFSYVEKHVDKLYEKHYAEHDVKSINEHCDFIGKFIESCGWDQHNFTRVLMGFDDLDLESTYN